MLLEILIKNFAIIEEQQLDWQPNLTVITGETGAGKSIVLDAIELALGKRASTNIIYPGRDKADINLIFSLTNNSAAQQWLEQNDLSDQEQCTIRRVINQDGRSKSYINGIPVSLPQLRELAHLLISLHGQNEFQTLLQSEEQREIVDRFAQHKQLLEPVNSLFQQYQSVRQQYDELLKQQQQTGQLDLWRYQLQELEEQAFTQEELTTLEQEQKQLAHAEKITLAAQNALNLLEDDDVNTLSLLDHAQYTLQNLHSVTDVFTSTLPMLEQAYVQISEAAREIRHQMHKMDLAPDRLVEVEQRLSKAFELARKHHVPMHDLPDVTEKLKEQVNQLSHAEENLLALEKHINDIKAQYLAAAEKLHQSRVKTSKKLAQAIAEYMPTLGMPGGQFIIDIQFLNQSEPKAQGLDKITFQVSSNPGMPVQALNKVASGGELSRISLAIQVIIAQFYPSNTLIFDEVDVGIGGATADHVGQLLRKIGEKSQVICVTHLAQVAAKGHHHFKVEKQQTKTSTKTSIQALLLPERIQEIARMSGGAKIDEKTLEHARALLATAD